MNETDSNTTIAQARAWTNKFRDERNWRQYHHPKNTLLGLVSEVGEIADILRYLTDAQLKELLANPEKKKELDRELADVLWDLLYLSDDLNVDLASALREKIAHTEKKYPVEKTKGSNKKHDEY